MEVFYLPIIKNVLTLSLLVEVFFLILIFFKNVFYDEVFQDLKFFHVFELILKK